MAVTGLGFGYLVARREQSGKPMGRWAFLALMWSAVLVSYLKSLLHPKLTFGHGTVELLFTLAAVVLTWMVGRKIHQAATGNAATGY